MTVANIACKQLGFGQGAVTFYGQEINTESFSNISCNGNESNVLECGRESWHLTNCNEAVYVVCNDNAGTM